MPTIEKKRLAKNTVFLYLRMILVMGVGLFTSRVILNALGVNDFGIYNVIGGLVSLFSVVSSSLTSSISRYITFEIGQNNLDRLKKTFSTSLAVQLVLCAIIIVFIAPLGFWFLNLKMNIAPSRLISANWVLFFSILTFLLSLISLPYNACIIAHERMKAFAYVGIIEVLLKLGVAYLIYIFKYDRLILYSFLLFLISLILRIIYGIYCKRNFIECKTKIHYYKDIFKEMSQYAGWSFIGNTSSIIQRQGSNVILNLIFGTIINAAFSIGNQVSTALISFSNNFLTALNPQLTKAYARQDLSSLISLINQGSRFGFFLLWVISIIVLFNTSYILNLWLKNVPNFTVQFVQLFIVFSLIQIITSPIVTTLMATGKIKYYQICVGGLRFIDLPICYLVLKLGYPPYFSIIVSISLEIILIWLRLIFINKYLHISISDFLNSVILRISIVIVANIILNKLLLTFKVDNFGMLVLYCLGSFIISLICIFLFGIKKSERVLLTTKMQALLRS